MDKTIIVWAFGIIFVLLAIYVLTREKKTVANVNKMGLGVVLLLIGVFAIALQAGWLVNINANLTPFSAGTGYNSPTVVNTGNGGTVVSGYQPTATFSAKDSFSTSTISGTSYYKRGNAFASTTAISNVNPGESITYWVDNSSTYYVQPLTQQAGSGVTSFNTLGWKNGSITISAYDLVGRQALNGASAYNISMGANDQANVEITYQGTAKQSAMPFGGLMVIELNSTIPTVTCNGDDLVDASQFHLTYTVASISNHYKVFGIAPTIDTGNGEVRKITCQIVNGATAAGNGDSLWYVKFFPANYYVSQAGNFVLDTEKNADGSTTRTALGFPEATYYWDV